MTHTLAKRIRHEIAMRKIAKQFGLTRRQNMALYAVFQGLRTLQERRAAGLI